MLTFNRQAVQDAAYLLACYLEPLPKADTLRARLHRLGYTPTPTVYRAGMALELGEGTDTSAYRLNDEPRPWDHLAAVRDLYR